MSPLERCDEIIRLIDESLDDGRPRVGDGFDEVVVPLDLLGPSDAVVSVASSVARRAGVGLRLISVSSPGLDHSADEQALEAVATKATAPTVSWEVVESNDVAPAILDRAGDSGLVCLDARIRLPLAALVLGSTSTDVLLATTRPVLVVGPETRPDLPLEVMEACIDRPDAATALVPVMAAWARHLHVPIRLVHAIAAGEEPLGSYDDAVEVLADLARRLRSERGELADTGVLVGTSVPDLIVEDAQRHRAGIIAVAMRRHARLRRRTFGSVALAVARRTHSAVLAVPVPH